MFPLQIITSNLIINSPLEQFEVTNLLGLNAPIFGYLYIMKVKDRIDFDGFYSLVYQLSSFLLSLSEDKVINAFVLF